MMAFHDFPRFIQTNSETVPYHEQPPRPSPLKFLATGIHKHLLSIPHHIIVLACSNLTEIRRNGGPIYKKLKVSRFTERH